MAKFMFTLLVLMCTLPFGATVNDDFSESVEQERFNGVNGFPAGLGKFRMLLPFFKLLKSVDGNDNYEGNITGFDKCVDAVMEGKPIMHEEDGSQVNCYRKIFTEISNANTADLTMAVLTSSGSLVTDILDNFVRAIKTCSGVEMNEQFLSVNTATGFSTAFFSSPLKTAKIFSVNFFDEVMSVAFVVFSLMFFVGWIVNECALVFIGFTRSIVRFTKWTRNLFTSKDVEKSNTSVTNEKNVNVKKD
jgi:hypothetical protein